MIVTIATTKGGAAKTTTAMLLAEAAGRAGHSTLVIDADPQGSATQWKEVAEENGEPIRRYTVTPVNRVMLSRVISKATEEWVFIDTPPGDPAVINEAIELADFVIVPSPVAPEDFNRAVRTLGTTGDTPAALFLCHWDKRATKTYEAIKEAIEDQDLPVFDSEVPNKQQVQNFWFADTHTGDLGGYQDLFTELSQTLKALNP
ncbi:ParA family protein [Rothia endophytica]|uniref:CobQ/CobB/MinD/ParA nucleotide binding domain-containing protein n=1 Tax=Rothia endophytica TaxID=1324766 RepID=A0ABP9BQB2_9MICC